MHPYLAPVLLTFYRKLYLHDTTAQTLHSLSTQKMLSCLLINLRNPKVHYFSEKRSHTSLTAQVMRFMQK